ncbi:TIR domain-containing protein [Chitinimonas taiwanensis]|uniref:TIR domain-containing protein n=1 Tax=Chitinimonas taiwanensis TaxID=240412 RepID=UPI0009315363
MTTSETDFSIFYSWQSDLPDETNRRAIRSALRTASSSVEAEYPGLRIALDEATRGEAGSPNIPLTILEKIKTCDAFVCDITTINASASSEYRKTPNPNVLFELGYAVAHIGWGRIVMLFNEALGTFPLDAPFDIDRHRVSTYRLSRAEAGSKSALASLSNLADLPPRRSTRN